MSIPQLNGPERLLAAKSAAALRKSALTSGVTPSVTRQPDAVSISDTAKSLAAARKAVSAAPDVREDRVSALKAAIADGTYSVDSRRLARAMVSLSDK